MIGELQLTCTMKVNNLLLTCARLGIANETHHMDKLGKKTFVSQNRKAGAPNHTLPANASGQNATQVEAIADQVCI